MLSSPIISILFVSLIQYVVGALWYSPLLFGKMWMDIMGVSHLSKEELQKMQKSMLPFYGLQLLLTLLTTTFLYFTMHFLPLPSGLSLAFLIWLGFIMPTQVTTVLWGNTKKNKWLKQILITTSYQLLSLLFAAFVFK
jgi:hypothetical protein